jgi:shikimate kinase
MSSKVFGKKSVFILVGPKGSGKTYIGSLLEKETGLKFLSVEKLGLENTKRSKLTGYEREKESFHEEEAEIDRILARENAMSFEATGSSDYFLTVLGRLRSRYEVKLVRIVSPLDACYRRIKQRDAKAHLPVSEEMIKRINEKAAKVDLDWDLTIDNSGQPAGEQIVAVFKKAFGSK